jgi:hypothetical protein
MLLRDLNPIYDIKAKLVSSMISESITDYFAVQLSKLKNKPTDELFDGSDKFDIEQLAKVITALKVLSNKDYRSVMSREDIGIHPNSAKELFKFLDTVEKSGKNDRDTEMVFNALKQLAPSMYRKELEALEKLKNKDSTIKQEAVKKIEELAKRVNEMFKKLKELSSGAPKPEATTLATQKMALA